MNFIFCWKYFDIAYTKRKRNFLHLKLNRSFVCICICTSLFFVLVKIYNHLSMNYIPKGCYFMYIYFQFWYTHPVVFPNVKFCLQNLIYFNIIIFLGNFAAGFIEYNINLDVFFFYLYVSVYVFKMLKKYMMKWIWKKNIKIKQFFFFLYIINWSFCIYFVNKICIILYSNYLVHFLGSSIFRISTT